MKPLRSGDRKLKYIKFVNYALPIIFGAGVLGILTCYKLKLGIRMMESDSASDIYYAYLLSTEGWFVSNNWFFSTALRLFDNEMLFALLFRMFPGLGWWEIETIGTAIMNGLIGLAGVLLARQLGLGEKSIWLFGLSLLPYGWSDFYYVLLHGCGYYGYAVFQVYLILSLYLSIVNHNGGTKKLLYVKWLCYIGLSLLTGIQGVRLLENLYLPLVWCNISLSFVVFCKYPHGENVCGFQKITAYLGRNEIWRRYFTVSLTGALLAMAGYAVNKLVLCDIFMWKETDKLWWKEFSFEPIEIFLGEVLSNLGYMDGLELFSKRGAINLLSVVLCIFIAVVLIKSCKGRIVYKNNFIIYFFLTAVFVHLFIYVFLMNAYKARYMLPFFMVLPHVVSVILERWKSDSKRLTILILFLSVLLISCNVIRTGHERGNNAGINIAKQKEMADFLVENQYQYGFSTFWYGNSTIQLSDGKLEICSLVSPYVFEKYEWLCPKDKIDDTWTEKVFFIVSDIQLESAGHMNWNQEEKIVWHDGGMCVFEYKSVKELKDTFKN